MDAENIRKYDRLKNSFFKEHSEKYTWMDDCLEFDLSEAAHKLEELRKPALEFFERIFEEIMEGTCGEEEGFKKLEDYLTQFLFLQESYKALNQQLDLLAKITSGEEGIAFEQGTPQSPLQTNKEFRQEVMDFVRENIQRGAGLGYGDLSDYIEVPSTSSTKKQFAAHVKLKPKARATYQEVNGSEKFPSAQIIHNTLRQNLEINSERVPKEYLKDKNEYLDFALEQLKKFVKRSDIQKLLALNISV